MKNNCGSNVPLFTDWINQLQKFIVVAGSLGFSECTCVILYGQSIRNFVAVLADETEALPCWASFATDFIGKCSSLVPVLSGFSAVSM
jgi:hypothetical protein